jgi:hypothetical protein
MTTGPLLVRKMLGHAGSDQTFLVTPARRS